MHMIRYGSKEWYIIHMQSFGLQIHATIVILYVRWQFYQLMINVDRTGLSHSSISLTDVLASAQHVIACIYASFTDGIVTKNISLMAHDMVLSAGKSATC